MPYRILCRRRRKKELLVIPVVFFLVYNLISLTAYGPRDDLDSGERKFFVNQLTEKRINVARISNSTLKPFLKSHSNKTWWHRPDKSPSNPLYNCSSWFYDSFEENLNVIRNYPRGNADEYLWKIGGNRPHPNVTLTSFPVIATAANSAFYDVTQGLLKSVHEVLMPKYGDIKIVYYDLGLLETQYHELVKYCKCEVRKFPFGEFPSHVSSLKTYTWKPIIIHQLLMEFGFVWWADASVRFISSDLEGALDYSRKNSFLIFTYAPVLSVAFHTDPQTMQYLGEDPCKYRHFGENEATFVLFHYDEVSRVLVGAWAACALNEACMCPPDTAGKLHCSAGIEADGRCHRFDQAVLSILFRRLYHDQNDYPLVSVPFNIHQVKRGNRVHYFPLD